MIRTILFSVAVGIFMPLLSQDITFKKDVALVNGVEYCQITEETRLIIKTSFTVYNSIGDELLFLKLNEHILRDEPGTANDDVVRFYTVTNTASGEEMEMEWDINFKKNLIKQLYNNNVITPEGFISEDGYKKFNMKAGCKCTEKLDVKLKVLGATSKSNADMGTQAPLAKRNRSAMIFVANKEIKQDNQVIGTYERTQAAVVGGVEKRYTFTDNEGNLIAQAVMTA